MTPAPARKPSLFWALTRVAISAAWIITAASYRCAGWVIATLVLNLGFQIYMCLATWEARADR